MSQKKGLLIFSSDKLFFFILFDFWALDDLIVGSLRIIAKFLIFKIDFDFGKRIPANRNKNFVFINNLSLMFEFRFKKEMLQVLLDEITVYVFLCGSINQRSPMFKTNSPQMLLDVLKLIVFVSVFAFERFVGLRLANQNQNGNPKIFQQCSLCKWGSVVGSWNVFL